MYVLFLLLLFYTLKAIQKKNAHTLRLENLKEKARRPKPVREEMFKNGLGESVSKKVDSTMWLRMGKRGEMH